MNGADCSSLQKISAKIHFPPSEVIGIALPNSCVSIQSNTTIRQVVTLQAALKSRSLSHNKSLKTCSLIIPALESLRHERILLLSTKLILDIIRKLQPIKTTLVSLMSSLDTSVNLFSSFQRNQLEIFKSHFNKFTLNISSALEGFIEEVDKLSTDLERHPANFATIVLTMQTFLPRIRYLGSTKALLIQCKNITSYLSALVHQLLDVRAMFCFRSLVIWEQSFEVYIMLLCNLLFQKFYKLTLAINRTITCKLKHYDMDSNCEKISDNFVFFKPWSQEFESSSVIFYTISDYLKELAHIRASTLSKQIVDIPIVFLEERSKTKTSDNSLNGSTNPFVCPVNLPNCPSTIIHKFNINFEKMRNIYKKYLKNKLRNEQNFFFQLTSEISVRTANLHKNNKDVYFGRKNGLCAHQPNTKVVFWESKIGSIQKEFMYQKYMKHVWKFVKNHINSFYLDACLNNNRSCLCRLCNMNILERDCLLSCKTAFVCGKCSLSNLLVYLFMLLLHDVWGWLWYVRAGKVVVCELSHMLQKYRQSLTEFT